MIEFINTFGYRINRFEIGEALKKCIDTEVVKIQKGKSYVWNRRRHSQK